MDVLDAIVDMLPPLALPIVAGPTIPAMEPRFLQDATTDACTHDDMADVPHFDLLNASFDEDWPFRLGCVNAGVHASESKVENALEQRNILVFEMPILVDRGAQQVKMWNVGHIKMGTGVCRRFLEETWFHGWHGRLDHDGERQRGQHVDNGVGDVHVDVFEFKDVVLKRGVEEAAQESRSKLNVERGHKDA
ncbi:hypothetical protein AeNC1_017031 [Aphanomyces euteiches]|nr:hypothetical protein AeNC1_017031 [Aphanomyces euteiches]